MNFEVAIYNTLCVDEIRVLNSIKAAYLYADKVRVYDHIIPLVSLYRYLIPLIPLRK